MFAPLARLVALVRAQPALAVAAGGVGLAVAVPVLGRLRAGPPADQAAPPPAATGPLGIGLTAPPLLGAGIPAGGDASLAVGSLASQYNEGNNLVLGEIGRLRDLVQGAAPIPGPLPALEGGRSGVQPPIAPRPPIPAPRVGTAPAPAPSTRPLTAAEVAAILRRAGHPTWNPPGYARVSEAQLLAWIRRAESNRATAPATRPDQGASASFIYTVVRGDSLAAIASRFGVPGGWPALYQLNRATVGANPNLIRPGQRLVVIRTR